MPLSGSYSLELCRRGIGEYAETRLLILSTNLSSTRKSVKSPHPLRFANRGLFAQRSDQEWFQY